MEQPQSLFVEVTEHGECLLVRMDGVVDEDSRLLDQLSDVSGAKLVLETSRIERLNSCGIRDWVKWIRELERRHNAIHLVACSPVMVMQINSVKNFCGAYGCVVTFEAPYHCEACGAEKRESLLPSAIGGELQPPTMLCDGCGEAMEFDDLPATYFSFTKVGRHRTADPDVLQLISQSKEVHLASKILALKEISAGRGAPVASNAMSASAVSNPSLLKAKAKSAAEPLPLEASAKKG